MHIRSLNTMRPVSNETTSNSPASSAIEHRSVSDRVVSSENWVSTRQRLLTTMGSVTDRAISTLKHTAYIAELRLWQQRGGASNRHRKIAVAQIQYWLENPEGTLNLSGLNLASLPKLPDGIQALNVSNNRLRTLPKLPDGLVFLNVSYNQLSSLNELPVSLRVLSANSNPFTSMSEDIWTAIGRKCIVQRDENSLSEAEYEDLMNMQSDQNFSEAYTSEAMSADSLSDNAYAGTLGDVVANFYDEDKEAIKEQWDKFAYENGSTEFLRSLVLRKDPLDDSLAAQNKQNLIGWLNWMAHDPEWRKNVFSSASPLEAPDWINHT